MHRQRVKSQPKENLQNKNLVSDVKHAQPSSCTSPKIIIPAKLVEQTTLDIADTPDDKRSKPALTAEQEQTGPVFESDDESSFESDNDEEEILNI